MEKKTVISGHATDWLLHHFTPEYAASKQEFIPIQDTRIGRSKGFSDIVLFQSAAMTRLVRDERSGKRKTFGNDCAPKWIITFLDAAAWITFSYCVVTDVSSFPWRNASVLLPKWIPKASVRSWWFFILFFCYPSFVPDSKTLLDKDKHHPAEGCQRSVGIEYGAIERIRTVFLIFVRILELGQWDKICRINGSTGRPTKKF